MRGSFNGLGIWERHIPSLEPLHVPLLMAAAAMSSEQTLEKVTVVWQQHAFRLRRRPLMPVMSSLPTGKHLKEGFRMDALPPPPRSGRLTPRRMSDPPGCSTAYRRTVPPPRPCTRSSRRATPPPHTRMVRRIPGRAPTALNWQPACSVSPKLLKARLGTGRWLQDVPCVQGAVPQAPCVRRH